MGVVIQPPETQNVFLGIAICVGERTCVAGALLICVQSYVARGGSFHDEIFLSSSFPLPFFFSCSSWLRSPPSKSQRPAEPDE